MTVFFFLLVPFIVVSCKEEALDPEIVEEVASGFTEVVTSSTPLPIIVEQNAHLRNQAMASINATSGQNVEAPANWTQFGPFTVTGDLTLTSTNFRVVLGPEQGYATGVYFCDVYRCSKSVTLPAGALMHYDGASKEGYVTPSNPNVIGVNVNQTGNTFEFATWSLVPRYNTAGQNINHSLIPIPIDLTGTEFTYYYVQFIP